MTTATARQICEAARSSGSKASQLERAYRLYCKRIARCRTENQRNRVHIALENYMTPQEVRYLAAALIGDRADSPSRKWIARLESYLTHKTDEAPAFVRRGTLRAVTRYSAEVGAPAQKTLLLCFAGIFHRLMVPTPAFLDCLDPARYDVVFLRDYSKSGFGRGIAGLGEDFFAAMRRLPAVEDFARYRRTVALGTSSGALPALMAAILFRLHQGIAIGSMDFPEFASWLESLGIDPEPYAALVASRPDPFPALTLVYCAGCDKDSKSATALHSRVPSTLWAATDCAGHTVLASKLMLGRLPAFLSRLLASPGKDASRSGAQVSDA